jgi:thioredoxin 1
MNKFGKIAIVAVLIAAVAAVIAVKYNRFGQDTGAAVDVARHPDRRVDKVAGEGVPTKNQPAQPVREGLPSLIDLGAGTCIPCKLMAPILEELKTEFAGQLHVEFLDVHKNPDLIAKYRIRVIPTQIFFDASGKELYRHESYMGKEDILAKWKELGVEFKEAE